jgi:hypothetical protein
VLRQLAAKGKLRDVALETHTLLSGRSVSDLSVTLQEGDFAQFSRRFSVERLPRQIALRTAADWLRVSLCEPFDAAWLARTWKADALSIAARVLRECLDGPSRCDELYAWLTLRVSELPEDEERISLEGLLCQHAILRYRTELLPQLTVHQPRQTGLGYATAARFLEGDMAGAQLLLDEVFGAALRDDPANKTRAANKRVALPQCGAVAPVLALLLRGRDTAAAGALGKRLLAVGTSEAERGTGRAFRTLLHTWSSRNRA